MSIVASFIGVGVPELMFFVGVIVVVAVIAVIVQGVRKGYRKGAPEGKK